MFQHFIITRFNLRKKGWEQTQGNTKVLTDEWMDNRLELFEKYCYASCLAQREKNFTWLVFFDVTTSDKYRRVITRLAKGFPAFTPLYIEGMDAFLPEIKNSIQQRLDQPYLITTRLDNDDCLSQDYVLEVQKQFLKQDFLMIDFMHGLTLQIEPELKLGKHLHLYNPFASLIESANDFETIWNRSHGSWSKVKNVKSVRCQPLWLSIIHKENKENRFLGFASVNEKALDQFNISASTRKSLEGKFLPFEAWRIESWKNQLKVSYKTYFKLFKRKVRGYLNLLKD